ncbi:MAG: DUF4412 domain-containing protein [Terriglobales bacterium]
MKLRLSTSLLLAATLFAASLALAQTASPFSADMKISGGREGDVSGKMFFGGQKTRLEMNAAGHQSVMISDLPRRVMYMLMPQQQMYMEMHIDQMPGGQRDQWKPYDASNPCAGEAGATCKKVGSDLVNGRMCDKWLFSGGQGGNRTVWIDQKSHIPIKSVHGDTTWELLNIKEGPQPASLFEVPSGYQKMDMGGMGGMMRQRPH